MARRNVYDRYLDEFEEVREEARGQASTQEAESVRDLLMSYLRQKGVELREKGQTGRIYHTFCFRPEVMEAFTNLWKRINDSQKVTKTDLMEFAVWKLCREFEKEF